MTQAAAPYVRLAAGAAVPKFGVGRSPGGRRRTPLFQPLNGAYASLHVCTPALLCRDRYERTERGPLKTIDIPGDIDAPGSELRQRQIARSRRVLNTVREEFTRSRARRPAIIVRRRRTRGITT